MATSPENEVSKANLCDVCKAEGAVVCPHLTKAFDNVMKDPLIGKLVGERYQVEELIGTGGFGRVYKVFHVGLKHHMALKLLHSSLVLEREKLERFKQEAEAISKLDHPNICRITDFAEGPEQQPCMIMELLEGSRLDEVIKTKGRMSRLEVLDIGVQVCSALSAAHKKGIVHRDLKPANIILVQDGPNQKVKVLDFGLAKVMEGDGESGKSLTQTGGIVGTPHYMSPEQCLGRPLDGRTDVYAIGCILYEALSGKKAFDGASHLEIMNAHLQKTPASIVGPNADELERSFEAVLMKAMEQEQEHRHQSVDELLTDLQQLKDNQKVNVSSKKAPPKKKGNWMLVAASAACLIAAVGIVTSTLLKEDLTVTRPDVVDGKTLADLNREIEANPESADAFFERGNFHARRDERDNAIEDYSTAIKLDPKHADAYVRRSNMYVMTTKYEKALSDANHAIALIPRWYRGFEQKARVEQAMEAYQQAIADGTRALQIWKDSEPALEEMGHAYSALGQHQKAMDCVTRNARTGDPNDIDNIYWSCWDRGLVYLHAREFDLAVAEFRKAVGVHHKMAQSWGDLAAAYAAQDKMDEALDSIRRTIALDTFPARAFRLKGEMYRYGGKWNDAIQQYSSSTSLEPWYGPGFQQRALAEIASGQMHSAELDLKKAVDLQAGSAINNSLLAVVEDQLGKTDDAARHLTRAFEITPDLPANFLARARIEMHAGDFDKAIEDLNKAITLDNRMAEAYDVRATALKTVGRNDEAEKDRAAARQLHWHEFSTPLKLGANKNANSNIPVARPPITPLRLDQSIQVKPGPALSNSQTFALACGAMWTDNFYEDRTAKDDTLEMCEITPFVVNDCREFLKNEYGASDKKSMIECINSMFDEGKNSARKDLLAVNYCRIIAMARLSFHAQYFNESEAWAIIMKAARKLQSSFASWEDLQKAYGKGKEDVLGHSKDDMRVYFEKTNKLLHDPSRPPSKLPFKNTKLD